MTSEATKMAMKGNMYMYARVVEVTEFIFDVSLDLRGHLEAAMTSDATKMATRGNMHMDTRVIEDADFKSELKFDL